MVKRFRVDLYYASSEVGADDPLETKEGTGQPPDAIFVDGFSSIVLAMGSKPDNGLAEELRGVVKELHVVGDAMQVGRIAEATAQAAEVALEL